MRIEETTGEEAKFTRRGDAGNFVGSQLRGWWADEGRVMIGDVV